MIAAFDVINAVQRYGSAGASRLKRERMGKLRLNTARLDLFHGAGKDLGKLFLVHRLQQVLERTHVKGIEYIPLIAGHKDNDRLCHG